MMVCLIGQEIFMLDRRSGCFSDFDLTTIIASIFLGEFTFLRGWEAIYKGLFRFFRIALFPLPPSLFVIAHLQQTWYCFPKKERDSHSNRRKQDLEMHPVKHWLFRPFQGIGIGLLFATKLLGVLQVITGPTATASLILPRGASFKSGRLLIVTGITVLVSLLLIHSLDHG